jgi:hypothetical protein
MRINSSTRTLASWIKRNQDFSLAFAKDNFLLQCHILGLFPDAIIKPKI